MLRSRRSKAATATANSATAPTASAIAPPTADASPAAGAYLLDIRTTSITPDGADRVCQYDTQFMFTVE